jgi:hypothetical protein
MESLRISYSFDLDLNLSRVHGDRSEAFMRQRDHIQAEGLTETRVLKWKLGRAAQHDSRKKQWEENLGSRCGNFSSHYKNSST